MLVQLVHAPHDQIFVSDKYLVVCLIQVVKGSIHDKLLVKIRTKLAAYPQVEVGNLVFISYG